MKKLIDAILACEPEPLKAAFLRRYLPAIRDFSFGEGAKLSDKELGALTLRVENELNFLLLMDLPDDPGLERARTDEKQYVLAAMEDQGNVHAALYERKAFLSGERETKLCYPAGSGRVWSILDRCRLSDDAFTTVHLHEVLSDVIWALLRDVLCNQKFGG